MKRTLIFGLVVVLIAACTKTNSSTRGPNSTPAIVGQWELRESIGGLAGDIKNSAGNGMIVEFGIDSKFKFIYPYTSPATQTTGTYQITKVISEGYGIIQLNYDSANFLNQTDSVRIEDNKLILSTPPQCCDMVYKTIYEKLSGNPN